MSAGQIPRTPEKEGDTPERFKNAGEVIDLVTQMFGADQKRSVWRSDIDRLWSGEPVYPLSRLQKLGQSWRARTNYRGLEAAVTNENSLDYDLETQGRAIVKVCIDMPEGQERDDMEGKIEREFKWLLQRRWSNGYNLHIPKRIHNKNLHGMGFHIWPDNTGNWIPRTPNPGEILFPDGCPFNFSEEGDYFAMRDSVPSYVLYRKIQNPKEARLVGWNPDVAWRALTQTDKRSAQNLPYGALGAEQLAAAYRNGDIGYTTTRQSTIYINSVFVREYETGKISQYSFAEGLDINDYLYCKRNKFDDWPLEIFPYDIGTGDIHSVKGMGARMKEFFEMMNRVQNAMVDQVMLSSYPSMKPQVQNLDPDKMKLMRLGGMNLLPYGVEPSLVQFPGLDQGPLALKNDLMQTMVQQNRGGANGIQQQDRMTSEEYQMRAQEINHLSSATEAMQRAHLDNFYDRILRLVCKPSSSTQQWSVMAKEFRERLAEQGVPQEILNRIYEVKAVVAYGKGSASARTNALMQLMQSPVYLNTSEDRRVQIDRQFTASLMGQEAAEEFCRSNSDNDIPDSDDSFAVQENNNLEMGKQALAAARQNHSEHLAIHLGKATEIINLYQQGQIEPQMAYIATEAFGQHIKQHLDFLAQNPLKKQEYQEFFNGWQQLSRIADKMEADIESAADATPPEEQISEKLQIGLAGVQAKQQVDFAKMQGKQQLDRQKQAFKEEMEARKLASGNQRENIKLATTVQRDNAYAVSDIAQSTAKTSADIRNKNRKTK